MPRVAGQEKPRNHKPEEHKAQMSLLTAMEELRETRLDMTDSLVQIAQALIFCGLPYRRTEERQIERKTRASDGSTVTVTFTASRKDVDLPYGSDRTLLHWLIDKAIKTKSPFVSWEYASDFLWRSVHPRTSGSRRPSLSALLPCNTVRRHRAFIPRSTLTRLPPNRVNNSPRQVNTRSCMRVEASTRTSNIFSRRSLSE